MNKYRDKLDAILDGEGGADFVRKKVFCKCGMKDRETRNIKNEVVFEIKTKLGERNILVILGEIRHSKEIKYKKHEEMEK